MNQREFTKLLRIFERRVGPSLSDYAHRHIAFERQEAHTTDMGSAVQVEPRGWLIRLPLIDLLPTQELKLALLAHEVAHCLHGGKGLRTEESKEELANGIARSWGFKVDDLWEWEMEHAELANALKLENRAVFNALHKVPTHPISTPREINKQNVGGLESKSGDAAGSAA